ncbi:aminotransferase class I/II-fold pyridoxal phosphate-dependent enzyme [Chloracidobacterium validum]|uniref:Aminotransferase class I/II-fold pyridoxal phosphate-dependent enzyme n=1 Tax=Chloracidobacterium validum TaxID=2821543 RepID=A0ABX8B8J8_9BACT|nr:GntG family PLP-dependent aldolase [Chloracidobacterium validum]QUW03262.1 aminotransferase class I/II-fold pyridoxal phosphate-dependent enzyme [Chloracidobacterium validum]
MAPSNALVDLRSDTVTRPSPAMREAMYRAAVGDDVYLEDPTVNELQVRAAALLGFEAALFVPTGTMGNQICLRLHAPPGSEIIVESRAHVYEWELGALAAVSGLVPRLVPSERGLPTWEAIAAAIQPNVYYRTQTALICLENTHNMHGGTVADLPEMTRILREAAARNLPVHLDGARLFNAAVTLGRTVAELAQGFSSVMVCLSKGLGAPAGSLIFGTQAFIERARVVRKMFGGGMRQAGVLAAAGLVALEEGPAYLAADHANATWLAAELANLPRLHVDITRVETNIVMCDVTQTGLTATAFCERLKPYGVLAGPASPTTVRLVTHRDAPFEACRQAVENIRRFLTDIL